MHSTLSVSHEFTIPAHDVWDAMRWDNADFFEAAGIFTRLIFKNPPDQRAAIPSSRTVYFPDGSYVDETLVECDVARMYLRFQLDEPQQYGLAFFEGAYRVETLAKGTSRLTNSAAYALGERTQVDFETAWHSNQAKLFGHLANRLGSQLGGEACPASGQ